MSVAKQESRWQDWGNVILGLWVFGSPWFLEHSMLTEAPLGGIFGMWSMWFVGLAVLVIASVATYAFKAWTEWTVLILGLWLLISPWVLGFSQSAVLMWNAVIFGTLILVLAAWVLLEQRRSRKAAR